MYRKFYRHFFQNKDFRGWTEELEAAYAEPGQPNVEIVLAKVRGPTDQDNSGQDSRTREGMTGATTGYESPLFGQSGGYHQNLQYTAPQNLGPLQEFYAAAPYGGAFPMGGRDADGAGTIRGLHPYGQLGYGASW